MAPYGLAVEGYEQVVAGLLQLHHTHVDGTPDHALAIKVQDGLEDVGADAVGYWVLAPLIWLARLQ